MMNASQISLASISSPLQHTLIKTEFSYPKGGPSQEQMKFLGSRENLSLFGVPFGSAAVAYSQMQPPPFVDTSGSGSGSNAEASQEPSEHVQESTDDTVVENSTPGSSQMPEEPIPEAEEPASAIEAEIPNRTDSQGRSSSIGPTPVSDSSAGKEKDVMAASISRPTSAAAVVGEQEAESASAVATSKMNIPITIIREPSPAPPTPPPTPPRQSLNVTEEAPEPPVSTETAIAAAASG